MDKFDILFGKAQDEASNRWRHLLLPEDCENQAVPLPAGVVALKKKTLWERWVGK